MSEYRDHAYERTIVSTLQRILLDRFVSSDSPPKETLVCEEVFVNESPVPQEALMKVFEKLGLWEADARSKMNEFKWRKEAVPLPFLKDGGPAEVKTEAKDDTAKPKRKRSKKDEPPPEGSGESQ